MLTLAIAAGAVLLWASDKFHNMPVTWLAIGAATICLLPGMGPLRDVSVFQHLHGRTWILLVGVLGALTLFQMTGLSVTLSASVADWLWLSRGDSGNNYAVLILLSMAVSVVLRLKPLRQSLPRWPRTWGWQLAGPSKAFSWPRLRPGYSLSFLT